MKLIDKLMDKLMDKIANKLVIQFLEYQNEALIQKLLVNTGVYKDIYDKIDTLVNNKLSNKLDFTVSRLEDLKRELSSNELNYKFSNIVQIETHNEINKTVKNEKFIDDVVERIKKKQL